MSAIRRAYHRTDRQILKRKANDVRRRGGSTAVIVILINGEMLVVANIGESCEVICEDGIAGQLSVDHEPLKEPRLIESKGGFVTDEIGTINLAMKFAQYYVQISFIYHFQQLCFGLIIPRLLHSFYQLLHLSSLRTFFNINYCTFFLIFE